MENITEWKLKKAGFILLGDFDPITDNTFFLSWLLCR